jgi:hypothetical protein
VISMTRYFQVCEVSTSCLTKPTFPIFHELSVCINQNYFQFGIELYLCCILYKWLSGLLSTYFLFVETICKYEYIIINITTSQANPCYWYKIQIRRGLLIYRSIVVPDSIVPHWPYILFIERRVPVYRVNCKQIVLHIIDNTWVFLFIIFSKKTSLF